MQARSLDLSEGVSRVLEGEDRPAEIARRFEGSRLWVYRVRDRRQETGVRGRFQVGGHRRSRLPERGRVPRAWIAAVTDLPWAGCSNG